AAWCGLSPQRNSHLAAYGRFARGICNRCVDGDRIAQTVRPFSAAVDGAYFAPCHFRDAILAGPGSVLVAAKHFRCTAADGRDGDVHRDSHGFWRDFAGVLVSAGADVLPSGAAQRGSGDRSAAAGDHRMSTARTTEIALSTRAGAYVALTKPDVSFL